MKLTVDLLVNLAQEIEKTDPVLVDNDVDRNLAYHIIASQLVEMSKKEVDQDTLILLASVLKLSYENFVLQHRILNGSTNR